MKVSSPAAAPGSPPPSRTMGWVAMRRQLPTASAPKTSPRRAELLQLRQVLAQLGAFEGEHVSVVADAGQAGEQLGDDQVVAGELVNLGSVHRRTLRPPTRWPRPGCRSRCGRRAPPDG